MKKFVGLGWGWGLVAGLVLATAMAIAGSSTITIKDGAAVNRTYSVVTDGSGNFVARSVVCDQAAAASCATVSSNNLSVGQATASNLNATVVGTGTFATQSAQSGTWTVQPGNTSNTSPWLTRASDGTSNQAVKAASTSAALTDPAAVVAVSPNAAPVCTGVTAITQTTSTDVKTFTNTGFICSIVLVSDTAQFVAVVEGTGSVCATGGAALLGSTTVGSGLSLAANGGFSAVAATPWLKMITSADHLCVLQSGAGRVGGVITWQDHS